MKREEAGHPSQSAIQALVLLYGLNLAFPSDLRFILLWLSLVVIASMVYGFNVEERKLEDMTSTLLGIVYVVFFSFHIVLIDQTADRDLIWLVFLAHLSERISWHILWEWQSENISFVHI